MRRFINENIENYYINDVHITDPKFVSIDENLDVINEPLSRQSLKGLDVVFFGSCISFKNLLYLTLLYTCDEGVNSIHLASVSNDDSDDLQCAVNYIHQFDECKMEYIKLTQIYKTRCAKSDWDDYRFKPFEKVMKIDSTSFIPKRFDRLIKSLTIHAFDNNGELLM